MARETACAVRLMLVFLTVSFAAPAISQEPTDSFDFAEKQIGSWAMTATTYLDRSDRADDQWSPTAVRVGCRGEAPQGSFMLNDGAISSLRLRFLGPPRKDGGQNEITLLGDHLWLYLDGDRWEFANIPSRGQKFTNGNYPPVGKDEMVVTVWRGHQAVRRSEQDPWLDISMIYERLMDARKIEWGYKSRDWAVVDKSIRANRLPDHWTKTRYSVDNDKLRQAIVWCGQQVASDVAYVLPDRFR
jgi:hypothetical protein